MREPRREPQREHHREQEPQREPQYSPPEDNSRLQSMANSLLSYMDKPWKVIAIVTLTVIGVVMYTVYERRDVIASAILEHYVRPRVSADKFAQDAVALLAATGADFAQIWEVSLDANQAVPIAGYAKNGAVWMPNPNARPVVHDRTNPKFFIQLVHGDVLCTALTPDAPLFRAEYSAGAHYACGIGVPRFLGIVSGFLYIGWAKSPTPEEEYNAGVVLQSEADKILN